MEISRIGVAWDPSSPESRRREGSSVLEPPRLACDSGDMTNGVAVHDTRSRGPRERRDRAQEWVRWRAIRKLLCGFVAPFLVIGAACATPEHLDQPNVILISLRQSIIPDHLLGRVASGYRLFVLGALPIGALFGGGVARAFGLTAPYWVGGVTLAIMAFAWLHVMNNQTVAAAQGQLP